MGRLLDGGSLRIIGTGGTVLAELRLSSPAFAVSSGIASAHPLDPDTAQASGVPVSFEVRRADGSVVFEGQVGTDLFLDRGYIEAGARVSVRSFTYMETL